MKKLALALCVAATPALAWNFTSDPVCTIWHDTGTEEMRVTYDPREALPYAIVVDLRDRAWPAATPYMIRFEGVRSFAISTRRHQLNAEATQVTAADTGFGNVLAGLARSVTATAILGETTVQFPLVGAAEAVDKFESCTLPGMS